MSHSPLSIRDLALVSGLFAAHAPALVSGARAPASASLLEYSQLSRKLLKQWWLSLEPPALANGSAPLVSLAEEVLVTEMTIRIVAGVFAICDARTGRRAASPFARSALLDVMQAKHWVLSRLVTGPQPLGALLRINQLRRKTERWCDCLLGNLPLPEPAVQFAIDADRMQGFARKSTGAASTAAQYLTLVSLRLAMPPSLVQDEDRIQTHRAMLRSLMAFWPAEAFDADGLLRGPLWQRLRGLTDVPATMDIVRAPRESPLPLELMRRRLRSRAPLRDDDQHA
ncbi:MAG: hypothetical protein JNG89_18425 [Planctomycetaceae bacterium]|nr:hypothetical protein [Planctomycetaceae bacterium]